MGIAILCLALGEGGGAKSYSDCGECGGEEARGEEGMGTGEERGSTFDGRGKVGGGEEGLPNEVSDEEEQ